MYTVESMITDVLLRQGVDPKYLIPKNQMVKLLSGEQINESQSVISIIQKEAVNSYLSTNLYADLKTYDLLDLETLDLGIYKYYVDSKTVQNIIRQSISYASIGDIDRPLSYFECISQKPTYYNISICLFNDEEFAEIISEVDQLDPSLQGSTLNLRILQKLDDYTQIFKSLQSFISSHFNGDESYYKLWQRKDTVLRVEFKVAENFAASKFPHIKMQQIIPQNKFMANLIWVLLQDYLDKDRKPSGFLDGFIYFVDYSNAANLSFWYAKMLNLLNRYRGDYNDFSTLTNPAKARASYIYKALGIESGTIGLYSISPLKYMLQVNHTTTRFYGISSKTETPKPYESQVNTISDKDFTVVSIDRKKTTSFQLTIVCNVYGSYRQTQVTVNLSELIPDITTREVQLKLQQALTPHLLSKQYIQKQGVYTFEDKYMQLLGTLFGNCPIFIPGKEVYDLIHPSSAVVLPNTLVINEASPVIDSNKEVDY